MSKEIVSQKSCIEKFLRIIHPANARIALVIINRDTDEVNERYTTPSRIPKFLSFLRFCNANGCDIYFTPSELKPNRKRKRKKSNFLDLQSIIYLEFDQPNTLDSLLSANYPYPSAIVASSQGRHHVYWRLAGPVSKHRQEELMSNIARDVGSDTVATDTSRLLRLPTFCNKKASRENFRSSLIYPDQEVMIEPTTFDDLASAVDNYQESKASSIPSGVAAPPCASFDLSQSGRDWFLVNEMLFAKGDDPQEVIEWLEGQSGRKPNPHYYAKRTVSKALKLKGDTRYAAL